MPTCDQCGDAAILSSVIVTIRGRRLGNMWVCAACFTRLVDELVPPAVDARAPKNRATLPGDEATEKRCSRCGATKPLDQFDFWRGKPQAHCRVCRVAARRAARAEHPDVVHEQNHRYWEAHREAKAASLKVWRAANREKMREYGRIYRAKKKAEKAAAREAGRGD